MKNAICVTAIGAFTALSLATATKADTAQARCDYYPEGEDTETISTACTFSQSQGYITIAFDNGQTYVFTPSETEPNTYAAGNGVEAKLDTQNDNDDVSIYRISGEGAIYVWWENQ